jgi:hypothetical protein
LPVPALRTDSSNEETAVGSRNKQRATFEKRQREMARQERQAEKRARRRAKGEQPDENDAAHVVPTDVVSTDAVTPESALD